MMVSYDGGGGDCDNDCNCGGGGGSGAGDDGVKVILDLIKNASGLN